MPSKSRPGDSRGAERDTKKRATGATEIGIEKTSRPLRKANPATRGEERREKRRRKGETTEAKTSKEENRKTKTTRESRKLKKCGKSERRTEHGKT